MKMQLPVEKIRRVFKIAQQPISLETPIGEDGDSHFGDFIEDQEAESPVTATAYSLMQEQIVHEIESNDPRYLVYVHVPNSWGREQDSRVDVLRWFGEYRRRYGIIGLADLEVGGRSEIRWGEQGASMRPQSETWAAVYERRPGAR